MRRLKRILTAAGILAVSLLLWSGAGVAAADQQARDALIDDIINTAQSQYEKTNGRLQRAQYSGDIYVCKNFTVYLFNQNADRYRMAAYPDTELRIPNNLPPDECVDFAYGQVWEEVAASQGNPFYAAAEFRYNDELSMEDNREIARELMMQVMRGDYFQMSADYYYGVGAHSLIFIENYDPEFQTVHWTDSNMKGEKRDGIRYGLVQFNAEKNIDWFVDAFCHPSRGATLYRLRDDIIFADGKE
ncbi:MAG TPA: hypothetical protein PKU80_05490 [Candidatus Limiplasma sp.]|nr:hypothetical protein [Candidatus Limiplasma sp.]HRX09368.1 hypothetical protein [Candidatus Limiplasma sp.]